MGPWNRILSDTEPVSFSIGPWRDSSELRSSAFISVHLRFELPFSASIAPSLNENPLGLAAEGVRGNQ